MIIKNIFIFIFICILYLFSNNIRSDSLPSKYILEIPKIGYVNGGIDGCGPIAGKYVLKYLKIEKSLEELRRIFKTSQTDLSEFGITKSGTIPEHLSEGLKAISSKNFTKINFSDNIVSFLKGGTRIDMLKTEIYRSQCPVICLISTAGLELHYITIFGWNEHGFLKVDENFPNGEIITFSDFEKKWSLLDFANKIPLQKCNKLEKIGASVGLGLFLMSFSYSFIYINIPQTVTITHLHCDKTEDWGEDEIRLLLFPDIEKYGDVHTNSGNIFEPLARNYRAYLFPSVICLGNDKMKKKKDWYINKEITFNTFIGIHLWDVDGDGDDFLGQNTITRYSIQKSYKFTRNADYTLYCR